MKIAFFIIMHRRPEQAARLIKTLDGPDSVFFVHVDRRAPNAISDCISRWSSSHSNVRLVKRHACRWGGFGVVAATLECVHDALRSGDRFDCAILLSGQDYPIKPFNYMREYLDKPQTQFLESFRLDQPNRWTTHSGPYQAVNKISWHHIQIRSRSFHIPVRRCLPIGLRPYGGSTWWCLTRDCLAYVDDFVNGNSDVLQFFRHVFIPDESLFQTVISNSQFGREVVCDDLHYVDWTRPNPNYPRTLDGTDFERIQLSAKLFARKFDMSLDSHVLDLVDRELLNA
jgi:hypothetical protein